MDEGSYRYFTIVDLDLDSEKYSGKYLVQGDIDDPITMHRKTEDLYEFEKRGIEHILEEDKHENTEDKK